MTSSVDSLRRRVATMKARTNRDWIPRTWVLLLEEGEEIPPVVEANMRPNDRLYIREYPQGFLGAEKEGDWSWGYVYWHGGASIIWPDGRLEKVRKR